MFRSLGKAKAEDKDKEIMSCTVGHEACEVTEISSKNTDIFLPLKTATYNGYLPFDLFDP